MNRQAALLLGITVVAAACSTSPAPNHRATEPPGLTIGANVVLPLRLDGDRLGLSSLDGAAPSPITDPGIYSSVHIDASGRVVYAQSSGEQAGFYRIEGGKPRRVIPTAAGAAPYLAQWSPDGSRAAWIEAGGGLRIAQPDAEPMPGPSNAAGFRWSPDSGRLMAWTADRHTVFLVDARSGTSSVTQAPAPASWSTAGDIAALDLPLSLAFGSTVTLAREDGSAKRTIGALRVPPEGPMPLPAFSPDGAWLAWDGADSATNSPTHLVVMDVRSGAQFTPPCPTCATGSDGGSAAWSPDGRSLAWVQDGHVVIGRAGIWSGAIVADGWSVAWSPDSASIAYVRWRPDRNLYGLFARTVAGGDETLVVELADARGIADDMAWSADGKHLVVPLQVADSSQLYGLNPATGDLRALVALPPGTVPDELSPDGAAFYDRGPQLVQSLDGTSSQGVAGGEATDWSRDGKRMLVVGPGLSVVDIASGAKTSLLDGNVQDAVWSPDERRVAFVRDQRLGVVDLSTGASHVIVPDLTAMYLSFYLGTGYLAWSPDGKRIAFADWRIAEPVTQGQSDVYLVDPDGEHLTRITDSASSKRYFAFAPDGHHLAYTNLHTPGVEIVDVETRDVTALPNTEGKFVWISSDSLLADAAQGIVLDALDGPSQVLVENTGGCVRRLVGWTGAEVIFASICTHRGL